MKRPYYIPPIITAAVIAVGFLATAATSIEANHKGASGACAMAVNAVSGTCGK